MSEMVERVARAICASENEDPDRVNLFRPPTPGCDENTRNWMAYRDQARAAISAMREPTEAMKAAGSDQWTDHGSGGCGVCAGQVYEAMIAEALK